MIIFVSFRKIVFFLRLLISPVAEEVGFVCLFDLRFHSPILFKTSCRPQAYKPLIPPLLTIKFVSKIQNAPVWLSFFMLWHYLLVFIFTARNHFVRSRLAFDTAQFARDSSKFSVNLFIIEKKSIQFIPPPPEARGGSRSVVFFVIQTGNLCCSPWPPPPFPQFPSWKKIVMISCFACLCHCSN